MLCAKATIRNEQKTIDNGETSANICLVKCPVVYTLQTRQKLFYIAAIIYCPLQRYLRSYKPSNL